MAAALSLDDDSPLLPPGAYLRVTAGRFGSDTWPLDDVAVLAPDCVWVTQARAIVEGTCQPAPDFPRVLGPHQLFLVKLDDTPAHHDVVSMFNQLMQRFRDREDLWDDFPFWRQVCIKTNLDQLELYHRYGLSAWVAAIHWVHGVHGVHAPLPPSRTQTQTRPQRRSRYALRVPRWEGHDTPLDPDPWTVLPQHDTLTRTARLAADPAAFRAEPLPGLPSDLIDDAVHGIVHLLKVFGNHPQHSQTESQNVLHTEPRLISTVDLWTLALHLTARDASYADDFAVMLTLFLDACESLKCSCLHVCDPADILRTTVHAAVRSDRWANVEILAAVLPRWHAQWETWTRGWNERYFPIHDVARGEPRHMACSERFHLPFRIRVRIRNSDDYLIMMEESAKAWRPTDLVLACPFRQEGGCVSELFDTMARIQLDSATYTLDERNAMLVRLTDRLAHACYILFEGWCRSSWNHVDADRWISTNQLFLHGTPWQTKLRHAITEAFPDLAPYAAFHLVFRPLPQVNPDLPKHLRCPYPLAHQLGTAWFRTQIPHPDPDWVAAVVVPLMEDPAWCQSFSQVCMRYLPLIAVESIAWPVLARMPNVPWTWLWNRLTTYRYFRRVAQCWVQVVQHEPDVRDVIAQFGFARCASRISVFDRPRHPVDADLDETDPAVFRLMHHSYPVEPPGDNNGLWPRMLRVAVLGCHPRIAATLQAIHPFHPETLCLACFDAVTRRHVELGVPVGAGTRPESLWSLFQDVPLPHMATVALLAYMASAPHLTTTQRQSIALWVSRHPPTRPMGPEERAVFDLVAELVPIRPAPTRMGTETMWEARYTIPLGAVPWVVLLVRNGEQNRFLRQCCRTPCETEWWNALSSWSTGSGVVREWMPSGDHTSPGAPS